MNTSNTNLSTFTFKRAYVTTAYFVSFVLFLEERVGVLAWLQCVEAVVFQPADDPWFTPFVFCSCLAQYLQERLSKSALDIIEWGQLLSVNIFAVEQRHYTDNERTRMQVVPDITDDFSPFIPTIYSKYRLRIFDSFDFLRHVATTGVRLNKIKLAISQIPHITTPDYLRLLNALTYLHSYLLTYRMNKAACYLNISIVNIGCSIKAIT